MHRRIARLTFLIWLYVSMTGVVVFAFLKEYAFKPVSDVPAIFVFKDVATIHRLRLCLFGCYIERLSGV